MITPTKAKTSVEHAHWQTREVRILKKSLQTAMLVMAWIVVASIVAQAQETSSDVNTQATSQSEVVAEVTPPSPIDADTSTKTKVDAEKMKKVTILMSAIIGIVILGVGSIAGTMLWARHLRRLARDPGPVQKTVGNDFWFLKPPKPVVSDSGLLDGHRPAHSSSEEAPPE